MIICYTHITHIDKWASNPLATGYHLGFCSTLLFITMNLELYLTHFLQYDYVALILVKWMKLLQLEYTVLFKVIIQLVIWPK